MSKLGEEIQARIKQSLESEIAFYAGRGFITREEQLLITSTFNEAAHVATKTLPLELEQRSLTFPTPEPEETLTDKIEQVVDNVMVKLGVKAAYDDSPWSGDASQWKTAEAYCASCLIDMNTGSGPKTKDKCKLPYKKPGSSAVNKGALRAMASGGRGLPAMKGVPKEQMVKAANFMIRHWQAAFDKPAPANIYRMAGKTPPEGSKAESSVKFYKDNKGQWWMFGIYSNRWMDREHEILSESAHKEYADWVNKSGYRPQVTIYHLPKMPGGFWEKVFEKWGNEVEKLNAITKKVFSKVALGEVHRVVYLNGFSVAVAKIYPHRYEAAEKLAEMHDVSGMSHGFLAFEMSDPSNFSSTKDTVNIIEKYRSFEVSVLLRTRAANYGTAPLFVEGKQVAYSDEDKKFMMSLLPPDLVDAFDSDTKEASEVLDVILDHKELSEPVEEVSPSPTEVPTTPQESKEEEKAAPPPEDDTDEEDNEDEEHMMDGMHKETPESEVKQVGEAEVVEAVIKALNIDQLQSVLAEIIKNQKELSDQIADLKAGKAEVEKKLESLEQSEDEKIAAKMTPTINWGAVGYSPSQSSQTVISKEQKEEKTKNGPGAVPSITGDETIDKYFNSILRGS